MSIYNWLYKSKGCSIHQDLFENTCNNVLSTLRNLGGGKFCSIVNKIQVSKKLFQGKWVRSNLLMKIVIIKRPTFSISELLNCSCIISTALTNKTLKH